MNLKMSVLTAGADRGAALTDEWLSAAQEVVTPDALAAIAARAADKVAAAARNIVQTTAKQRTGALEGAIGHHEYSKAQGSGSYLTWEMVPLKREGRRRRSGTEYRDSSGRRRKVETVADVGRLLEFSASRKLRHINLGFDQTEDQVEAYMTNEINALLDEAGL